MPEYPWANPLHDAMDNSAFAGCVAPLKYNYHPCTISLDPFLHFDEFRLEFTQFTFVFLVLHFGFLWASIVVLVVWHFASSINQRVVESIQRIVSLQLPQLAEELAVLSVPGPGIP